MKFTLSWLKDHLETSASLDDISKTLTAIGLEVESITDASASLKDFTVAKILEASRHPEADKLQVCKVQSDAGELQIVCGAPNARAGLFVALAKEGAFIPGSNFTIKKTKIRGVESNGMLCSYEELGIAGDSSGIIELPEAAIGSSVATTLGLDDPLIDIAITPNRADCLGVRGIARDLAAAGLGLLKDAPSYVIGSDALWNSDVFAAFHSPISVKIEVSGNEFDAFDGYYIRDVKNVSSPAWLKKRLDAVGQKSISSLVDITNYLMLDLGRPMHAYDADKIAGNIIVRNADKDEKFKALNGQEYTLDQTMVVIADNKGAIGLAGIIGGESTACNLETKNVFLEVANFNRTNIAETARKLAIISEARYRFERGIDRRTSIKIGTKEQPIDRDVPAVATYLIHKFCGGVVSHLESHAHGGWPTPVIVFDPESVSRLGGVNITQTISKKILESLGFIIKDKDKIWEITPPSWRADVEGEADIVEEILRIHGYDNLPVMALPKLASVSLPATDRVMQAKRLLVAHGYLELCSYSFVAHAQAKRFGGGMDDLALANPISEDLSDMRPNLLPNLFAAAAKNQNRGYKNLRLAEVGLTYQNPTPAGQQMTATALLTGEITNHAIEGTLFKTTARPVDAMDAKRDMLVLLSALGISKYEISTETPSWYHPGRSGAVTLGKKIILGYFGEIHPALRTEMDIATPAVAFEIFLGNIPTPRAKTKAKPALSLSDYQSVTRDFAFVVDIKTTASDVTKAIASAEKTLITDIAIFDVYAGKGIADGKKSIALAVTLQAADRTLSDAEITNVSQAIIASVAKIGGSLRQ